MALKPSESPAITVKEVDLSGIVPAVTSSTGAIVGDFNWGPANQPILIGNEAELVSNFGSPNLVLDSNNLDFLSAATFLKYSGSLQVVRGINTSNDKNAVDSASATGVLVQNLTDWNEDKSSITNRWIAKYPGEAGNSLTVSICPYSASDSAFDNWAYASSFENAPGTSAYVSARSSDGANAHDEIHVAIVDAGGKFSGTVGTVLETWQHVSLATDAKAEDGADNHVINVINDKSAYVWVKTIDANRPTNVAAASFLDTTVTNDDVRTQRFSGGVQASGGLTQAQYSTGFDQFDDVDNIQVDFLIAPGLGSQTDQVTLTNTLVTKAAARKDCVVVTSPSRDKVINISNPTTITTNVKAFADAVTYSSYLVIDGNYLKVYDKYSDKYVFIPGAAGTAGLMAGTDAVAAPWFSPAGNRRGQYFGVSSLAWNPTKSQRDTLYKAGVNPIVNLPGQGILLFGDKTHMNRPSAFDRINVRRLFLVMERAIKSAAQSVMFEFNDEFTRAEFVNIVEPFLRDIKGRRGISDYRVVCDETNNTANIIDTNQFVADIYVKPARSINYITLSFVAVRTGVDFDEVVGLA